MESRENIECIARSLVKAQNTSLGTEVSTHVVYPNGDQVRAMVECVGDGYKISDGSLGSLYLYSDGIKLTSAQQARLQSMVAHYGCELKRGAVRLQCAPDRLADSIALVANASRTVADFGIDLRRVTDSDFRLSVVERLRKAVGENRLREKEPVAGRSGRSYRVGSVVLDRSQVRPLAFMEPFATRNTIGDRFTEFYDLRRAHEDVRMLSVYDDAIPWPEADLRLLGQVSDVLPFSKTSIEFGAFA